MARPTSCECLAGLPAIRPTTGQIVSWLSSVAYVNRANDVWTVWLYDDQGLLETIEVMASALADQYLEALRRQRYHVFREETNRC